MALLAPMLKRFVKEGNEVARARNGNWRSGNVMGRESGWS